MNKRENLANYPARTLVIGAFATAFAMLGAQRLESIPDNVGVCASSSDVACNGDTRVSPEAAHVLRVEAAISGISAIVFAAASAYSARQWCQEIRADEF